MPITSNDCKACGARTFHECGELDTGAFHRQRAAMPLLEEELRVLRDILERLDEMLERARAKDP